LVPDHGTTRCQYWSTGTGWCLQPVPNDHNGKDTGSWHHPVPIVQVKASSLPLAGPTNKKQKTVEKKIVLWKKLAYEMTAEEMREEVACYVEE